MTASDSANLQLTQSTERYVMASPMDDLPAVVPSHAGQHMGASVEADSNTTSAGSAPTANTTATHTHVSDDSPVPGDAASSLGTSSPRPSSHQKLSNGVKDHAEENKPHQGDEPGPTERHNGSGSGSQVGGQRTGEREREKDEEGMSGERGGETEQEARARIDLERALNDLRKEMGALDECDVRGH